MPALPDPRSHADSPTVHPTARTGRNRGVIAGALMLLACAAACSLPVLLAGGAALGAGAFMAGGAGIALAVLAATAGVAGLLWLRRRRAHARGAEGGCGDSCGC